jgi:hypothetical protein
LVVAESGQLNGQKQECQHPHTTSLDHVAQIAP